MALAAALAATGLPPDTPCSLATVDRHGRLDAAVSGSWPNGDAVVRNDRFYAASLAKQVTGAAVAVLVRANRIHPDAPIASYLDDLPEWGRTISARQLLHHTAGLPEAGVLEGQLVGDWTTAGVMAALRELPRLHPGRFAYSNAGYVVLAEIVAAVAGQSFERVAEQQFALDFPTSPTHPQIPLLGRRLPLSHGDGGLWCSAAEFSRWLDRQNHDEFGIEQLVTAAGTGAPDYGWGLGLRVSHGLPLLIHGGQWRGASAKAVRCPGLGIGVVCLAATDSFEPIAALVDRVFDDMATEALARRW